jgi:hypothetical protein
MLRKRLSVTVSASVPKGMSARHFRVLIKDALNGGQGIYLSMADQLVADTNVGIIRPTVSAAKRIKS